MDRWTVLAQRLSIAIQDLGGDAVPNISRSVVDDHRTRTLTQLLLHLLDRSGSAVDTVRVEDYCLQGKRFIANEVLLAAHLNGLLLWCAWTDFVANEKAIPPIKD